MCTPFRFILFAYALHFVITGALGAAFSIHGDASDEGYWNTQTTLYASITVVKIKRVSVMAPFENYAFNGA